MIKFLNGIWSFLNSKIFMYIIIVVIGIWLLNTCSNNKDLKSQKIIDDQNISALTDIIKIEKRKNGEYHASIDGFIASESELKKLNIDLYNKVNDQNGKVLSLNATILKLQQDTTILKQYIKKLLGKPIKLTDSTYRIPWELQFNWDKKNTAVDTINTKNYDIFNGYSDIELNVTSVLLDSISKLNRELLLKSFSVKHLNTEFLSRTTQIDLTFGQEVVDNKLKIFIESKYPGFTVESLSGVLIDPNTNPYIKQLIKKKHWFPNTWSFGIGTSMGYNIIGGNPYMGIGVNLTYNIYEW